MLQYIFIAIALIIAYWLITLGLAWFGIPGAILVAFILFA